MSIKFEPLLSEKIELIYVVEPARKREPSKKIEGIIRLDPRAALSLGWFLSVDFLDEVVVNAFPNLFLKNLLRE